MNKKKIIEDWLIKYDIKNAHIEEDDSEYKLFIFGDLNLIDKKIKELPHKIHHVTGSINLSYNKLKSFKNLPDKVNKLNISNNQLTSLKGCPVVSNVLDCSNNDIEEIYNFNGDKNIEELILSNNKIKSINELRELKGNILNVSNNLISSLKNCPSFNILKIENNLLDTLEGISEKIIYINCNKNNLKEINYTNKILKELHCDDNEITGIKNIEKISKTLSCKNNKIKDFKNFPKIINNLYMQGNVIEDYNDLKLKNISNIKLNINNIEYKDKNLIKVEIEKIILQEEIKNKSNVVTKKL